MTVEEEQKLPIPIKAGWATGAFGVAILMNGISALALFYLTIVVNLDPAVAGTIIGLSKLYDAVSDPFSGWISDRTQSKHGRRRPYLFWGALVSALSFFLVFNIPFSGPYENATQGDGLITSLYVLGMMILYTTGYSLFNVPYMAMPAEMTDGYHERSSVQGWRVMFASVGGFLAQSMGGYLLAIIGETQEGFRAVGIIGAVLILVTMLIAFFATKHAPSIPRTEEKVPFMDQLRGFAQNKAFQQVLAVKLVQLIGINASSGGLVFFLSRVIDKPLSVLPWIGGPMTIAVFVSTPLLVRASKYVGKRGGYVLSSIITGLAALSWVLAQPGEPTYLLSLRGFATGVAFAGNVLFAMSMLTDAMEADAHYTGVRREGMYSALYSFIEKISATVGPVILGVALSKAGFDPKSPPSEVTEEVRQAVLLGISYIPMGTAVLACAILAFYKLDEKKLNELRANSKEKKRPGGAGSGALAAASDPAE